MDDGADADNANAGDGGGPAGFPHFIGNDALEEGGTSRTRGPGDELPYDEDDDTDFCFASMYTPADDDTSVAGIELKEAYKELHAIIDRHFANNTSMADLVRAVQDFYEKNIRAFFDYGHWSRKSIYKYIMEYSAHAEDRQVTEGIRVMWNQVEFLRKNVAVRDETTGTVTPDLRMVKALADTIKLHAALVTEKRKRPRHAA